MQCGPGAQLTNDLSKLQGVGHMGPGPMGEGLDGDMAHMMMMGGGGEDAAMMAEAYANELHSHAMRGGVQQQAHNPPIHGTSASAAAVSSSAAMVSDPNLAMMSGAPMGLGMMMNPLMMGAGPMMGMGMGMGMGGPLLHHPYQMQMMAAAQHQYQHQNQQAAVPSASAAQQVSAPLPTVPQLPTVSIDAMLAEPLDESSWLQQFKTEQSAKSAEAQEEVRTLGHEGEDLRSVTDKTNDSEFYGFMAKVNEGKIVIDEESSSINEVEKPMGPASDDWMEQLKQAQAYVAAEHATQTANFVPNPSVEAWRAEEGGLDGAMLDGLAQQWNTAEGAMEGVDDYDGGEEFYDAQLDGEAWAKEYKELMGRFADAQNATDYPFEPENPFLFHDDPLSEGKQLLSLGILSDAVLAFEAACQKTSENPEAWKLLGTTQAENEKDMLAIRALNKAKQLSPRDKEVYMALSVSHANESNHAFALESLRGWLLCQPEYEMLVDVVSSQSAAEAAAEGGIEGGEDYTEFLGMMASPREMKDIVTLFGAAIEMHPTDAAVHAGLGIAYHLSHDFENAVACFRSALDINPNDANLWNKLGATLANSSKSEEAIQMYENALNINPGYVRARYNLGIAHNNLGHHEIAAQHFARAIVMQQGGAGDDSASSGGPPRSTREMWDALRMALNFTNRTDLVQHTWKQDIAPILAEFGLSDLAF